MIKLMPLTIAYYGPSTISHDQQSVVWRPCAGLQAIHRRYIISPPHNPHDNPVKLNLQIFH